MIRYKLEITPKLSICPEEIGLKRIFYLDTILDKSVVDFLRKKYRPTDPILHIEANMETLQMIAKTGRLFFKNRLLHWSNPAKLYWKEVNGTYCAILGDIALEKCHFVACNWALYEDLMIPIVTDVSWKWVELFVNGPVVLEGVQKKKFLDEDPPIISTQEMVIPELILTDNTGCFANLRKGDQNAEKDLLEAGFIRKQIGSSHYYCQADKVHEALSLLIAVGWKIFAHSGKPILPQSGVEWNVSEERGKIAIRGKVCFKDLGIELASVMKTKSLFIEMEGAVGLIERKKFEIQGELSVDAMLVNKGLLFFLVGEKVLWGENLQEMIEGLRNGEGVELAMPGVSFQGKLLPYQQKGVNFLAFLKKWGFSVLLADEMGLGKTVQVLAFFSHLRTNFPLLVVVPSSLLYQWKQEVHRFLPKMEVYIHAGINRLTDLTQVQGIIITSYSILRIDEEILSSIQFEVVALDEANAIKTAGTMTAKAACRLKSHFRIAISGTPMENRFDELLSQFQFLMPGFAITDPRQIKPFILRRKKRDVEIQLPEKIDQIVWVEMSESQAALYEKYISEFKNGILAKIEKDGISIHRLEVLEAILRLRQICVDPRLVGSEIHGSKMELLLDDLEESKTLIFSQFTGMLKLIAKTLDQQGKKYLYLDGEVTTENRARLVASFQEDPESTLFLMSLKAGGVGLNLTAAETVLIMDPWWNDAVEQQAIGRAHRIGSKKSVIVKRYLTPNSIEEKMLHVKEKKSMAAELLLDGEEIDLLSLFL